MNLSEALSIFSDQLPDIRKACVQNILAVSSKNQPYKRMEDDDDMTVENIRLHVNYLAVEEKTAPLLRVIKRIDGRRKHYSSKQRITDQDIERAKDIPIEELHDGQLFGRKRKYGLCPFHDEQTPSFYIFPDNKYKCFGCGEYGSSIDYIMKRDGVDFITAVKSMLQ